MAELLRAGADPARLLVVEVSERFPPRSACRDHPHAIHVDQIDVLVESDSAPFPLSTRRPPRSTVRSPSSAAFIPEGATLQTGIGSIRRCWSGLLAEATGATSASTRRCSPRA